MTCIMKLEVKPLLGHPHEHLSCTRHKAGPQNCLPSGHGRFQSQGLSLRAKASHSRLQQASSRGLLGASAPGREGSGAGNTEQLASAARKGIQATGKRGSSISTPLIRQRERGPSLDPGWQARDLPRLHAEAANADDEDDEEEDEDGGEDQGSPVSEEEAERLIFGNKDFTLGPVVPVDKAAVRAQCRRALEDLGLPAGAVATLIRLHDEEKAPEEVEALTSKVKVAVVVAGGPGKLLPAVQQLAAVLSLPEDEAWGATLYATRVLSMPGPAILQRASEVEAMLKVSPKRARELCCRSPALLLVPRAQLEAKLRAMSAATGLDMEACAVMLTLYMFPDDALVSTVKPLLWVLSFHP